MRILKDEFTFNYEKKEIQVKKVCSVHCAIFGKTAVPLTIVFNKPEEMHNGTIYKREGKKHLSWLPTEAIEEIEPLQFLQRIKDLLNTTDL